MLVLGAAHVRKHLTCKPSGCSMLPSLHTIFSIYFRYFVFLIVIYVKANEQISLLLVPQCKRLVYQKALPRQSAMSGKPCSRSGWSNLIILWAIKSCLLIPWDKCLIQGSQLILVREPLCLFTYLRGPRKR